MTLRTLLAAVLLLPFAAPLAAQGDLAAGMRVRVSTPVVHQGVEVARSAAWKTGTIKSVDSTTMVLQTDGEEIDIPLSVIRRMEVSQGSMTTSEGWREGAVRGAVVGGGLALATAVFGKVAKGTDGCGYEASTGRRRENCVAKALFAPTTAGLVRNIGVGAVFGSGVGVLFGSRAQERWTSVNLDRMNIISGDAGGTGVAFSLRF